MLPSASASAYNGIQFNLQQFAIAADRISDPNTIADVRDISQLKQSQQNVEINIAVLNKAHEMSNHLIDILA